MSVEVAPALNTRRDSLDLQVHDGPSTAADECSHYAPHAWIVDRCRECGRNSSSHTTSSLPGEDKPILGQHERKGSMNLRKESISSAIKAHIPVSKEDIEAEVYATRIAEHQAALVAAGHPPLSPRELRKSYAAEQMKSVVAKKLYFENEMKKLVDSDKRKLQNKEISEQEYQKSVKTLKIAFEQKVKEIRDEVELVQKQMDECYLYRANNNKNKELAMEKAGLGTEADTTIRKEQDDATIAAGAVPQEQPQEQPIAIESVTLDEKAVFGDSPDTTATTTEKDQDEAAVAGSIPIPEEQPTTGEKPTNPDESASSISPDAMRDPNVQREIDEIAAKVAAEQAAQIAPIAAAATTENQTSPTTSQTTPTTTGQEGSKYHIQLSCKCTNLPSEYRNTIICLVDRNERTNKLEYLSQTERISRSKNPAFKKRFPLTFLDGSGKTLRFNVYDVPDDNKHIEDDYRIGSAVATIQALVDKPGTEFVFPLSHKSARRQERLESSQAKLIVTCVKKEPYFEDEAEHERQIRAKLKEMETILQIGDQFRRHTETSAEKHQAIKLSYEPGKPPAVITQALASIAPIPPTEGSASSSAEGSSIPQATSPTQPTGAAVNGAQPQLDPDRFDIGQLKWSCGSSKLDTHLSLRTISDLYIGKKSRVFPDSARDEHCFSLVSKGGGPRLDLECNSKAQRDQWATAIIAFFKAASAQAKKDKEFLAKLNQTKQATSVKQVEEPTVTSTAPTATV